MLWEWLQQGFLGALQDGVVGLTTRRASHRRRGNDRWRMRLAWAPGRELSNTTPTSAPSDDARSRAIPGRRRTLMSSVAVSVSIA
jgi:hypothetical protein